MMSVFADGSTIYPSQLVAADAALRHGRVLRHRAGSAAQGRARAAVPAVRSRGADADSRVAIRRAAARARSDQARTAAPQAAGSNGLAPTAHPGWPAIAPRQGLAPYYNLLDPRVQEAMLDVVRELATRYAAHESFGGLALAAVGRRLRAAARRRLGLRRSNDRPLRARHRSRGAGRRRRSDSRRGPNT